MKKVLNKYEIKIQGLTEGEHEFEFEMGDAFFQAFEQDLIEQGDFKASVLLDKSTSMLRLNFHITGSARLTCDRSLDEFDYPIELDEAYLFKFGNEPNFAADEMEVIPFGSVDVNIAQHLFDFIALAVPVKKLHPRYEEGEDEEDYIYISGATNFDSEAESTDGKKENKEAENVDPRWAALAALRNKQDN